MLQERVVVTQPSHQIREREKKFDRKVTRTVGKPSESRNTLVESRSKGETSLGSREKRIPTIFMFK